jgi:hypothetical protein
MKLKDSMNLPYPLFILHLLSHTSSLKRKQIDIGTVCDLETPKPEIWTTWLNPELRDQFLACKNYVMPGASHSRFVKLLLEEHNSLAEPCKYVDDMSVRVARPLQLPVLHLNSKTLLTSSIKSPVRLQSFFAKGPTSPIDNDLPLLVKIFETAKKENIGRSVMDLQNILC